MFPPRKILFPVDFSSRSTAAANMVETFAGHFQAAVTMLHVVEPLTYNDLPVYSKEIPQGQLDGYLCEEFKHFDVKRVMLHGDPAVKIIEYAEDELVDMIMLPTHGYGRFRRFILGSVTAKVLHDARCPVWTGTHAEELPPLERIAFKHILCAVDLERQTSAALRFAKSLASEFGADLSIVHIIPTARDIPNMYVDQDWKEALFTGARTEIERLLASLGVPAVIHVEADEVPHGVAASARDTQADLLVIGRSVEDSLLGRLRTNAYSIIRQSPCPVISV